jgi:hypothetical protein
VIAVFFCRVFPDALSMIHIFDRGVTQKGFILSSLLIPDVLFTIKHFITIIIVVL